MIFILARMIFRWLTWDYRSQPYTLSQRATDDEPGFMEIYSYDALGRRRSIQVWEDGVVVEYPFYAYDGWRVIEEYDYRDLDCPPIAARYVHGRYIDEPLRMERDLDGDGALEAGEVFYYHQDDQFNVVALSDGDGAVVERYGYGDYGAPQFFDSSWTEKTDGDGEALTSSAYGNPFLFTGRRWNGRTGYYDYRTRIYDPAVGRFLSRDKIGIWGDPLGLGNGYAYVGNNPWRFVDPFGLKECDLSHGTPLGSRSIQLIWQNKAEDPTGGDIYYDYTNPYVNELARDLYRHNKNVRGIQNFISSVNLAGDYIEVVYDNGVRELIPVYDVIRSSMEAKAAFDNGDYEGALIAGGFAVAVALPYINGAMKRIGKADESVDLASADRRAHILDGDGKGSGGHRSGTGCLGKSEFPKSWSDDKIMHEISDIATDPTLPWQPTGRRGRHQVEGTRDGVDIKVILEKDGSIVTGFPTNMPRNP